jgi:deoxyribodipyrimidine photo-lyase
MRELWVTGWMPNRLRLIAAPSGQAPAGGLASGASAGSGTRWRTPIPANNPLNWQWIAGSGPDAQPFNRIFNPCCRREKFDPAGAYVRRWVPELAALPDAYIHQPWAAPPAELAAAGVTLGETYPSDRGAWGRPQARALGLCRAAGGKRNGVSGLGEAPGPPLLLRQAQDEGY